MNRWPGLPSADFLTVLVPNEEFEQTVYNRLGATSSLDYKYKLQTMTNGEPFLTSSRPKYLCPQCKPYNRGLLDKFKGSKDK